ncbi:hypothetical protein [Streptomyces sp. NPDC059168]|uniref:hypothetical protein n=1 Tax=Streptomyces sp. NPDC059168 TaxID=3346753 RepID=UPI0036B79EF5
MGTGLDQDAVLLDLLSRLPSSRRIRRSNNDPVNVRRSFAPPATIGVVGATSPFAVRGPQAPPRTELSAMTEPAPEMLDLVADRPLTALADIAFARLDTFAAWDPATEAPPELVFLGAEGADIKARLAPLVDSDSAGVLYALGVPIVASGIIAGFFAGFVGSELWQDPDMVDRWRAILGRLRSLAEDVVFLEEQAELDLPLVESLLSECLDTTAHRLDAWVTSLATARLAATRQDQPSGLRTGAYGWLVDVAPAEPAHRIASDGYLVAPSLHHATTAAVLRSGWLAHSNQDAFAVNLTSRRVRSALALLDGVRSGQDLAALLAAREALGAGGRRHAPAASWLPTPSRAPDPPRPPIRTASRAWSWTPGRNRSRGRDVNRVRRRRSPPSPSTRLDPVPAPRKPCCWPCRPTGHGAGGCRTCTLSSRRPSTSPGSGPSTSSTCPRCAAHCRSSSPSWWVSGSSETSEPLRTATTASATGWPHASTIRCGC